MAPPSSQASFEAANRQNDNASRHASQGFADLTSAINETWGAGMTRIHGVGQAIGENVNAAGAAISRNVNAAGAELARENRDVVRAAHAVGDQVAGATHGVHQEVDREGRVVGQAATDFGNGVARNVNAAGAELARENRDVARNVHAAHQELDREGRVIGQTASAVGDSVSRTAQAGANRIGDHYRDRPLTAALEGALGPIDGLARGGVAHEDRTAAPGDATPTQTGTRPPHHVATAENSAEARPPVSAGADRNHHQVKSGESYWSIAAAQGGTKAAIAERSQRLQAVNHGRALLPNLEIVMS